MKKQIPQIGTKEFNDLASVYFGGKPKQETLEYAAESYAEPYKCTATNENKYCKHDILSAFNNGAKWQQERSYSEEEVIKFGKYITEFDNLHNEKEFVIKEIFEQFKNK